jgi:hypothetical protein
MFYWNIDYYIGLANNLLGILSDYFMSDSGLKQSGLSDVGFEEKKTIVQFKAPTSCKSKCLLIQHITPMLTRIRNTGRLKGLCHEMNNFLEGLKNQLGTFCTTPKISKFFCFHVIEK